MCANKLKQLTAKVFKVFMGEGNFWKITYFDDLHLYAQSDLLDNFSLLNSVVR